MTSFLYPRQCRRAELSLLRQNWRLISTLLAGGTFVAANAHASDRGATAKHHGWHHHRAVPAHPARGPRPYAVEGAGPPLAPGLSRPPAPEGLPTLPPLPKPPPLSKLPPLPKL